MKDRNQALTKIFKNNIIVNCNFASIPGGSKKVISGMDHTIIRYWLLKAYLLTGFSKLSKYISLRLDTGLNNPINKKCQHSA